MSKPTLFFSHTSKDKELIIPIKEKINLYTGGVFDIFMSSDGQSIPFGQNWIHKVEEGLQDAKIMFVFVTEASLSSGWIYFEAGFAYSKGIQVVPVGIGIDIGELKPPLNLLQGFNITSGDSLNNFISIINRTFNYTIAERFSDNDYAEIINLIHNGNNRLTYFDKIISNAKTVLCQYEPLYSENSISKILWDADNCFQNILDYFEENNIAFSKQGGYGSTGKDISIVTNGIKLIYHKRDPKLDSWAGEMRDISSINLYISSLNFQMSFDFLKCLMPYIRMENFSLDFHLRKSYSCILSVEDVSSIISLKEDFAPIKEQENYYSHSSGLIFSIHYNNKIGFTEYIIEISDISETCDSKDIISLVDELYNIGIIYEN